MTDHKQDLKELRSHLDEALGLLIHRHNGMADPLTKQFVARARGVLRKFHEETHIVVQDGVPLDHVEEVAMACRDEGFPSTIHTGSRTAWGAIQEAKAWMSRLPGEPKKRVVVLAIPDHGAWAVVRNEISWPVPADKEVAAFLGGYPEGQVAFISAPREASLDLSNALIRLQQFLLQLKVT